MRSFATAMLLLATLLSAGCQRPEDRSGTAPATRGAPAVKTATSSFDAGDPNPAPTAAPPVDPIGLRLSCLAALYAATVEEQAGVAGLRADGVFIAWDDGRAKTAAQRLDAPDLSDLFRPPYTQEPPHKITVPDHDPGRVRVLALLRSAYGRDAAAVQRALVPVKLRRNTVSVHKRAEAAFRLVFAELESLAQADPLVARYVDTLGGTYNDRNIAGTERKSAHAFGIAIDLNPALANYHLNQPGGAWRTPVPEPVVRAFESHGFVWGGRWYHDDTMHFEYRPELFDARCTGSSAPGSSQ